jgi:hypothetical protein
MSFRTDRSLQQLDSFFGSHYPEDFMPSLVPFNVHNEKIVHTVASSTTAREQEVMTVSSVQVLPVTILFSETITVPSLLSCLSAHRVIPP